MSTHNPNSTSVDAQSSRELDDDFGLNNTHFPATPFDSNLLSPYNHSQTISNSASPSYNISSTPGESEYSNYQPSEFSEEDPFFGVNFDDGVQRIDSGLGNIGFHPADLNRPLPDLLAQPESKPSSATFTTSTYPLSPIHSSSPNSPYSKGVVNDTKGTATITQHELSTDSHNQRYQNMNSLPPAHPASLQLTPDLSSSSHTSAEGIEPSAIPQPEDSAANMASRWTKVQQQNRPIQSSGQYNAGNENQFGGQLPDQTGQASTPTIMRNEEGLWRSSETTGQAGLGPEARRELSDIEVPNLKDNEERRRIESKNLDIEDWRSQAGGSEAGDEQPAYSLFNHNPFQQTGSQPPQEDENNDIPPLDDAASVRENRPIEGQVYYDFTNLNITETDRALMNLPRHWYDPPSVPKITTTTHQPLTSNEAIMRFKKNSDTVSIASRAATWGTRRRRLSEPSISEYDAVIDGSFLKKLSISRSREGERRQTSFFDQGLDRLANIVRTRSISKIKRVRSTHNIPEDTQNQPQGRHYSAGTLAPPSRSSSFKRGPPSINTALAAMAGPLAAVGTTHTRNGSVSGNATSPKSPVERLGVRKTLMNRARSKSELNPRDKTEQTALAGLLRAQGGPPVAKLSTGTPQVEARRRSEPQQLEMQDDDDPDDDDDDQADEGDLKIESEQQTDPIIPNYEGFKAHVLRLNPDMDPRNKWLVSRIAHQQEIRYKNLLDLRVKHSQAILTRSCSAGPHCVAQGGGATLAAAEGRDSSDQGALHLQTEFSDNDSNPGEGALNDETFPQGVPMPPTRNLPAEFECQLCFKAKKFQKPSDWTKHVHEDVQPFTCTYDKCKEPKSFKRKADWVRHENERHRHLEWWICQVDDCRHPCYRKDNFLQHLVREHKLPEPKQKTKAAIKKARGTEPAWIMLEQCHHETPNRPQDEACKFCGKSFPTWKKLTVHLAKHMEHISLPILRLVELRAVDANTIISPVEQIISPVTPIGNSRTKMESSSSPFNLMNVSPHMPPGTHFASTGFEQPSYFPTAGSNYNLDSAMNYQPNNLYANPFAIQQPTYDPLGPNGMNTMNSNRSYPEMMDSRFVQPKMEQPSGYRQPIDTGFSNTMTNQTYNQHHPSGYSMPQNLNGATVVSGYPNPNILGISQAGYQYDPMAAVDPGQNFQQQTPMSRAQGSASSYGHGHSPQHVPPYYSQG
jgi:hypothetical protein